MWQMSRNGKNAMNKDPAYNATNPSHFYTNDRKRQVHLKEFDSF